MKTSQRGIDLIKRHEGLRLAAYLCPAGVPTIGYGHTKGVKLGQVITEEEAENLLKEDLQRFEEVISNLNINLNQNQFDALVSFAFNIGIGYPKTHPNGPSGFLGSTLLAKVKANPLDLDITRQFKRWVYANGRVLPGLVRRRNDESKLYFT